ncbi:MAG TPA: PIN domain-containing protein [Thermodesulfobacteriota bacterium]|nr:PIN domain-containing protein [Thermodesulfobacteriota bacterium]
MSERIFLDTNVLVYLFDNDAPDKQNRAREIFSRQEFRSRVIISTQVLQEFYVAATRKLAKAARTECSLSSGSGFGSSACNTSGYPYNPFGHIQESSRSNIFLGCSDYTGSVSRWGQAALH